MNRASSRTDSLNDGADNISEADSGAPKNESSIFWIFRSLINIAKKNSVLALFDQGIVSATRFATSVLIGRICGPEDLAFYTIAFAILLLAMAVQEALISKPYTVFSQKFDETRTRVFAGSVLLQHGVLALLVAFTALAAGFFATQFDLGHSKLILVILLLALMIPFTLLWDLLRRITFAHLNMQQAAIMDATLAVLQLSLLVGLAYFGQLYLQSAVLAITFATAFVGLLWLGLRRKHFQLDRSVFKDDCRKNWNFGNWLLASQLIGTVHGYAVPWVLTFLLGATTTGIFVAAQSIVLLTNPLILGMGNWLGPRAASTVAHSGLTELRNLIYLVSAAFTVLMFAFAIMFYFGGAFALEFLYGELYHSQHWVIAILGLCPVSWCLTLIFGNALAVIEETSAILWGTLAGTLTTFLLVVPFSNLWALEGAAGALLAGSSVTAIYLFLIFSIRSGNSVVAGRVS
ncbi:MAG: lipopolysaccharide biosynthesis protein [Pseudomonadota bacterium]